jgi:hypothetical protein
MRRSVTDEGTEQLIRDTVNLRISIALIDGLGLQARTIFSDGVVPIGLVIFSLILGIFEPAMRVGFIGVGIIVSTASLYTSHRKLEKAEIERSKSRKACLKDIAERRKELPRELEFLADLDE